ncbi:MAG TPA: TonB-dependent receptor, partial [Sphingobium sp.]
GGGPGGGGFGGGRGGGGGGRLTFAIYHTINLNDKVTLADGQPQIDLLNGGTLGDTAGQPRHQVQVQAGFSQSGIGMRLTGNWQSTTHVVGSEDSPSSNLRFSDLATFNLRLFVNLGQRPELVGKMPWLRGARVQLGVSNIFNARQKVTDPNGLTPLAYRPGLIDPLGRTIQITLRKQLF